MSDDLTFIPKADDQDWDEAIDGAEEAAGEESAGRPDAATWARVLDGSQAVLGEISVHEGDGHYELSHDATGIQVSLFVGEAAITVPYWYEGEEADAVMAKVFRLGDVVERETGLHGYDPQVGLPLAEAAAEMGLSRATFDKVADHLDQTGLRPRTDPPA